MADLKPTYGNFYIKGIVTGLSGGRALSNGEKNSNEWNRISFGVKVADASFVYVELLGTKSKIVRFCRFDNKNKKYNTQDYIEVPYQDLHTFKKENYKLFLPIRVGFNNTYQELELTPYDAVNYLNENLQDGDKIFITGSLQITKYKDKAQESFSIRSIYKTEEIDLSTPQAFFEQEIVYMGLEEDFDRTTIKSYIIYRQDGDATFVPYQFVVSGSKESKKEIIRNFNEIPIGSTLKVYGDIVHGVKLIELEDGSKYVSGLPIKELQVTGGNLSSLVESRYSEDDFASIMNEFVFEESETYEATDILGF